MTTFYEAALENFKVAADLLERVQCSRVDLIEETRKGLVGRRHLSVVGSCGDVTPSFRACLPSGGQAELLLGEDGSTIELRCTNADWLTLEGGLSLNATTGCCHVEIQQSSDGPITADVFIREFLEDGAARDSGHQEFKLAIGAFSTYKLPLPEIADNVTGRRIIIVIRNPADRLVFDYVTITEV